MTAVYLVVGVKGGTGATTLCVDLARAARRVKRSVTVVDADLGGHRNVAELLDATRLLNANRGGSIFSVARSGDIDVVELVDKYDDSFALRRKDVDTLAADVSKQGDLVLVDAPRPFEGNVFPFATRSQRAKSASRSSPPHEVPSGPKPVPSHARPRTGPARWCSAIAAATWAWWCWTATRVTAGRARA